MHREGWLATVHGVAESDTTNLAHMHAFILKQHGRICPPFGLPIDGSSFVILLLYVYKIPNSHLDCVWAIMNRDSMKSYMYWCLSGLCSSGLLICIPIPYCFNYYSFVQILLSGEQVLPSYLFFPPRVFVYSWVLHSYINFIRSLSSSKTNMLKFGLKPFSIFPSSSKLWTWHSSPFTWIVFFNIIQ